VSQEIHYPDREHSAYWARWKFARLALPLKARARELGYALLVHGSLARDIDMVAVPWAEDAAPFDDLVRELVKTIREHNDGLAYGYTPEGEYTTDESLWSRKPKPHGRVAVSIHVGGVASPNPMDQHGTYIDLSVMPVMSEPPTYSPSS